MCYGKSKCKCHKGRARSINQHPSNQRSIGIKSTNNTATTPIPSEGETTTVDNLWTAFMEDEKKFLEYLDSPLALFEQRAYDIVDELAHLLVTKQQDYGSKNIADAPGGAMNGLLVRMHDKLARIVNLTKDNKEPNHESLHDSFADLANYSIIAIMVLKGWWEGAQYPTKDNQ